MCYYSCVIRVQRGNPLNTKLQPLIHSFIWCLHLLNERINPLIHGICKYPAYLTPFSGFQCPFDFTIIRALGPAFPFNRSRSLTTRKARWFVSLRARTLCSQRINYLVEFGPVKLLADQKLFLAVFPKHNLHLLWLYFSRG